MKSKNNIFCVNFTGAFLYSGTVFLYFSPSLCRATRIKVHHSQGLLVCLKSQHTQQHALTVILFQKMPGDYCFYRKWAWFCSWPTLADGEETTHWEIRGIYYWDPALSKALSKAPVTEIQTAWTLFLFSFLTFYLFSWIFSFCEYEICLNQPHTCWAVLSDGITNIQWHLSAFVSTEQYPDSYDIQIHNTA